MPEARAFRLLALLLLCLLAPLFAVGQEEAFDVPNHTWEVFVERGIDATGRDRLTFIDILTGETTSLEVYGERYTVAGPAVLYYDRQRQAVMLAPPEVPPYQHPFIRMEAGARRVDWALSDDGKYIAWTLAQGPDNAISTITYVAEVTGAALRELLIDGPRDGIRALPVAFSADHSTLYMDAHPDGLARFTAYPQYAGLFAVTLDDSTISSLPGEPGCFCGAGLGSGLFLRLGLAPDLSGFDVRVYDLESGGGHTIPAMRLRNYTQAGGVLVSPDGRLAVYALAQIERFGMPDQSIQTVFMLVDLAQMTQTTLTEPITTYVHPVRWTEDNTAVLFTSPQLNGTWKISLSDGRLARVARAAYLGTVQRGG